MAKPFELFTYDDAANLVGRKTSVAGTITYATNPRRPASAIAATDFFNSDHWQNSRGFIGQLPPVGFPGAASITLDIQAGFVSENVIQEVVETHVSGILGREPLWSFMPEQPPGSKTKPEADQITGETVTPWWNEREALKDLQRSAETIVLEGTAVRRLFFPKGRVPDGILTASDLSQALDFIYFQSLNADVAGVFTDPDSQKKIGIYLFEEKAQDGTVIDHAAELSFLNEQKQTVCKVVRDKGAPSEFGPYELGGHLLVFELNRRALITDQVQSNQKALNLAHTMMMRNVNMAGSRERSVINAQPPRRPVRIQDPTSPTRTTATEIGTVEVGAGATMFYMGWPIKNEKGEVIGYTNPNVNVHDPAPVDTFVETAEHYKSAIYSQCHQRHVLIVDQATTSGRAREQARAEFERSLKETKAVIDAAGRWQLETALRLAAQVSNQSKKYLNLRADFNCIIDAGDVDPEKIKSVIDMRQAGGPNNQPLISDETARGMVGIDDAAAELAKIEEEAPTEAEIRKRQELMTPPQSLTKNNGDGAIA